MSSMIRSSRDRDVIPTTTSKTSETGSAVSSTTTTGSDPAAITTVVSGGARVGTDGPRKVVRIVAIEDEGEQTTVMDGVVLSPPLSAAAADGGGGIGLDVNDTGGGGGGVPIEDDQQEDDVIPGPPSGHRNNFKKVRQQGVMARSSSAVPVPVPPTSPVTRSHRRLGSSGSGGSGGGIGGSNGRTGRLQRLLQRASSGGGTGGSASLETSSNNNSNALNSSGHHTNMSVGSAGSGTGSNTVGRRAPSGGAISLLSLKGLYNTNRATAMESMEGTPESILEMRGPNQQQQQYLTGFNDELQLSMTEHRWSGAGILASRHDLELPAAEFAAGCNLLQAAARGDQAAMQELLDSGKTHVNFRDYDRRTALHVAASEGHEHICRYLVLQLGAQINRSDRWGGSPLDDAHRHRHQAVIDFLRAHGATTGSGNRAVNLITAAASGDADEIKTLLHVAGLYPINHQMLNDGDQPSFAPKSTTVDINKGDYDNRTALHLAAGEGHLEVVRLLTEAGADVNVEDRWKRRPLDDAIDGGRTEVVELLQSLGAARGAVLPDTVKGNDINTSVDGANDDDGMDNSRKRIESSMQIDFSELSIIDKIGSGAFGEIYKCRWRGTLVAAKIIKSAKIRREWVNKRMTEAIREGKDVDDAIHEIDEAELEENEKDLALADFRQEISVLKSLRHPHIVLMLAYSTTENYECLISELMRCSLLDIFKSHMVQGTRMPKRTQIIYATQLALGMNYLHTCKPPIVHRDLKPANLLIDHSGVLKISDFGLSKVRPDPSKKESDKFMMTGETGSYRFMAPEVFRHENYNETVDVYSYAMILFYLLVGRPPWPTLSGMSAVQKAAHDGDRPNIPRDMDGRLQALLRECWADNPTLRPSFADIAIFCSAYNRDVFKQDTDTVAAAPPPEIVEAECQGCNIL